MTVRGPGARCSMIVLCLAATLAIASGSQAHPPPPSAALHPRTEQTRLQGAVPAVPAAAPQQADGSSPASRPWWGWVLLGRLHPMVVHFPIALLTAAGLVEVVHLVRRQPVPSEAGTYCLAFGVVGALASVCLGTLNAGHQAVTGEAAAALERHQVMGWISTTAAMAALAMGMRARRARQVRTAAAYVGLVLATGAVVGATGHLGSELVYGEKYLTGVLPWNEREAHPAATPSGTAAAPAVQGADGVDFTRDVMPILKDTCVECHGPDKVKARLRMDSIEALQKGGKSGALVKPGDPENSLLLRRVLGLDGEDQMPLDKDPLTEKQIDTLRRWIAAGATYPATASR